MSSVGVYEAKTHFPKLVARAEGGERITITRHGVPVAILVPPEAANKQSSSEVIAELREIRKGVKLRGLSIKKMIEEGRR